MKLASRPSLRCLVTLDRMLRDGEYPNARSAGQELEVCLRTILRDLEFLRDSWGAPLAFSHARNGFYYNDTDYRLPCLRLTEGELVALFLADRLMQQYADSPFAQDLATAIQKLTAALSDELTIDPASWATAFSVQPAPVSLEEACHFAALARAVRHCRQLELIYWTAGRDQTNRRVVEPYHLTSIRGEWYLVAYCHLREDVRMFAPTRIRQLRETGNTFTRPADFEIAAYLDGTFQTLRSSGPSQRVRLRFSPTIARYVRDKRWHPTQQIQEHRDGGLTLTFTVTHLLEVQRWAMSWGADCEVLEPEGLREGVVLELGKTVEQYAGGGGSG